MSRILAFRLFVIENEICLFVIANKTKGISLANPVVVCLFVCSLVITNETGSFVITNETKGSSFVVCVTKLKGFRL